MELKDVLYDMMQKNQQAGQPTDLRIGTVTSTSPLAISINPAMAPIRHNILYLTANVVEKKIPILEHTHVIHDTASGGGTCEPALENVACIENGETLPVENGYIIINRALKVGDKVVMLRVQNGQKFIVLSRVF